jgi:hypothetical protein
MGHNEIVNILTANKDYHNKKEQGASIKLLNSLVIHDEKYYRTVEGCFICLQGFEYSQKK